MVSRKSQFAPAFFDAINADFKYHSKGPTANRSTVVVLWSTASWSTVDVPEDDQGDSFDKDWEIQKKVESQAGGRSRSASILFDHSALQLAQVQMAEEQTLHQDVMEKTKSGGVAHDSVKVTGRT